MGATAPKAILTSGAVSRLIGIHVSTLRRWRLTRYGLPFVDVGGAVRYRREDVEKFIAARTCEPIPETHRGNEGAAA